MTYLLTNASALTALQSLNMTQQSLAQTQSELSTGLAIQNAQDNSSYWSISQTMSSDNGALGAVSSALGVSSSMLSTFNSAINQTISAVNNIKNDLVEAQTPGANLTQIQNDITAQQNSLYNIAGASQFDGQNWMNGTVNGAGSTAATNTAATLVGGYTFNGGVSDITLNLSNINMFTGGTSVASASGGVLGSAQTQTAVAGISGGYSVLGSGGTIGSGAITVTTANVANSDLQNMLASVNVTLTKLETAASTVGAALNQVDTMQTFVSTMQTNLQNGVASLVDANMNQVSTRLQALQTQQQLGVQSLSIANQSSQMILKLFQ